MGFSYNCERPDRTPNMSSSKRKAPSTMAQVGHLARAMGWEGISTVDKQTLCKMAEWSFHLKLPQACKPPTLASSIGVDAPEASELWIAQRLWLFGLLTTRCYCEWGNMLEPVPCSPGPNHHPWRDARQAFVSSKLGPRLAAV